MSALFNFQSLLTVVLLLICTCTYVHAVVPSILDRYKTGFPGIFWKCARIGERKSPWVAVFCVAMALNELFWQWNLCYYYYYYFLQYFGYGDNFLYYGTM